jgi:hypothetical protein
LTGGFVRVVTTAVLAGAENGGRPAESVGTPEGAKGGGARGLAAPWGLVALVTARQDRVAELVPWQARTVPAPECTSGTT